MKIINKIYVGTWKGTAAWGSWSDVEVEEKMVWRWITKMRELELIDLANFLANECECGSYHIFVSWFCKRIHMVKSLKDSYHVLGRANNYPLERKRFRATCVRSSMIGCVLTFSFVLNDKKDISWFLRDFTSHNISSLYHTVSRYPQMYIFLNKFHGRINCRLYNNLIRFSRQFKFILFLNKKQEKLSQ